MKKIIAAILLLTMVVTLCACSAGGSLGGKNKIDAGAMTLTKMATMPDTVDFATGDIVYNYENDRYQILDQDGKAFNDVYYDRIAYVVDNGVCVVSCTDAQGIERLGVLDTAKGKELAPCEAVGVMMLSDRFMAVGYMSEEGTENDNFGSYYIDGNRHYYKGYGKLLDLEKGRFVPNLEWTGSLSSPDIAGNTIVLGKDAYNADGKLLGSYKYIYPYSESSLVLVYEEENLLVYDGEMELLSTLQITDYSDDYEPADGCSDLLIHKYEKDGKTVSCVTDLKGNALTPEYTSYIRSVYSEGFMGVEVDGEDCIVDFAGNIIVSGTSYLHHIEAGYMVAIVDRKCYAYTTDGKQVSATAMENSNGVVLTKGKQALVLKTGETVPFDEYLTGSLVLGGNTVYDVVTGKEVFTDVDGGLGSGDNLYLWDEETETYTHYRAAFKPVK